MRRSRNVQAVAVAAATLLVWGCSSKGTVNPENSPTLQAASPVSLVGTEGGVLKTAPAVVVRDSRGNPLTGVSIQWRVQAGGGTVVDAATQTDGQGQASALWKLPDQQGTYAVVASLASGSDSVVFDAVAGPDTVPPALLGLERADSAVSVGDSAVTTRFTVLGADSGSGLYWTIVRLNSPGGGASTMCSITAAATDSTTDDTVPCDLTIPAHAAAGEWRISTLTLQDRIRNETQLSGDSLAALGYPVTVQVSSMAPDTTPPKLVALSFQPDSVDLDSTSATVTFTAQLADSVSGVAQAQLAVDAPAQTGSVECLQMSLKAGDTHDGTWSCPVTFPKDGRPGTWTLARFTAWDAAGNWKSWLTPDLEGAGFPTGITVTNADADTVPPVLDSLDVTPDSVQLSGSDVDIEVSIGASDAGVGVDHVDVSIRAPGATNATGCGMDAPTEGTVAKGVYRCTLTIPAAGVAGAWAIDDVSIVDAAGNSLDLSTQDLVDAGFNPYVQVTR